MPENPRLSIIVPVYNEEESLPRFYTKIIPILQSLNLSFEIIFINDGSFDRSLEILEKLHQSDLHVKYISFSRNFGHMLALTAGLDVCSGDAAITIDADLQHPPELIPELVNRWFAGAMVVNTVRKETKGAGVLKTITAGLFYWLINKIAKINLPANTADYRLLDRKVINTLKNVRERSRFLRGLVSWVGFKQGFVDYTAEKRFAGKTKYSFSRMLAFAVDGITSFSSMPLKLSIYLGFIIAFFSFIYILYALYVYFFTSQAIAGWTSVLVAVLFIGGIQLISLGIIGEYLSRVFDETKQRPLYIIDEKVGL
jgi:dolichol-phosphate mannosyltransferase